MIEEHILELDNVSVTEVSQESTFANLAQIHAVALELLVLLDGI